MSTADKTLVVVPYVGEFGWELMNWQGRVRWEIAHGNHGRVIVCARPDRHLLYTMPRGDARVVFCPVAAMNLPGRSNEDHRVDDAGRPMPPASLRQIVEAHARAACEQAGIDVRDATFLTPDYRAALWPTTRGHQLFLDHRVQQPITTDVVLVSRRRDLAPERNQPPSWWDGLAAQLEHHGLSVEMYTSRLDEAIHQLSRARLAVGASTGGLHMASLCRCPHYVWGCGPEERWTPLGVTNRQRYETVWNPFGTPCRYDECGWQPAMSHVVAQTRWALHEIGLKSRRSLSAWSFKPKWRVKRRLAGLLTTDPDASLLPWRVRELVKERMV